MSHRGREKLSSPRGYLRSTTPNMIILPFPLVFGKPIEGETDGSTLARRNLKIVAAFEQTIAH